MAAGGTAGHLAPALVVADVLKNAGHHVEFAASSGRRDAEIITARGYESHLFEIGGLPRSLGVGQLKAVWRALTAIFTCLKIIRLVKPDVLLAGGGFVAAPVAVAARMLRIPVVATEADAHLGLANRIAGRFAKRLCTAYPLPNMRLKQEVVGRPVAPEFFLASEADNIRNARAYFGINADDVVVAIVGGSGGATKLNDATVEAWGDSSDLVVGKRKLWVLHVTGKRDYRDVINHQISSDRYKVIEYCDDVVRLFSAADLVVSRPGGSVFELAAAGKAAVLVPSPNVTADHQTKNANWFVSRGGGMLLKDNDLNGDSLRDCVSKLLSESGDEERENLSRKIFMLARPDAAMRIADIVVQLGVDKIQRRGAEKVDTMSDTSGTGVLAGRKFHMLGIGGAGVSALAQIVKAWGAEVDGCDKNSSSYSEAVSAAGIRVFKKHDPNHIDAKTEVVASSALPKDHPELVRARELGCRVLLRGTLLGELTRLKDSVVIAGAHGKSTTTGMLIHAATLAGLDPAALLGATLPSLKKEDGSGGNVRDGNGPLIVEGDESDRTLLALSAKVAVVTNIERDHHHTFATDDDVDALFAQWVRSLGTQSVLIAGPGERLDRLVEHAPGEVKRFGVSGEGELERISEKLQVPGLHNALNALAACSVLEYFGIDKDESLELLKTFTGIGRRYDIVGGKDVNGICVVDDYAHHPTEVKATIDAAKMQAKKRGGRVLVAFQPHLYSRTQMLWEEFADALSDADRVWVLPIFAAREEPINGVSERLIADRLVDLAPSIYAGRGVADPATGDLATITSELKNGDIIVTMGAGDITKLGTRLFTKLKEQSL